MSNYKGTVSGVLPALVALNIRSSCPVCARYGVFLVWCRRCNFSLFSHQDPGYPFAANSVLHGGGVAHVWWSTIHTFWRGQGQGIVEWLWHLVNVHLGT